MSKLAIVIPAYKIKYFDQVLKSIANQTCKDFTLYIGDDASPNDFKPLIDLYSTKIRMVYKHFDENLGGKDLVAHYERCIDLVGNEEWIWLFSDDDFMDLNCVDNFYLAHDQNPNFDLFHFNLRKVDKFNNETITQFTPFPEFLTIEDFLLGNLQFGYYTTTVEYIFRKSYFYDQGRFQNFDLAWFSDTATWIKLGKRKGVRTIKGSDVYWRESELNISCNHEEEILKRKLYAQIEFIVWICNQAKENEIHFEILTLKKRLTIWILRSIECKRKSLPFSSITSVLSSAYNYLYEQKPPIQKIIFLYIYKIYCLFIVIFKRIIFWEFLKLQKQKTQSS